MKTITLNFFLTAGLLLCLSCRAPFLPSNEPTQEHEFKHPVNYFDTNHVLSVTSSLSPKDYSYFLSRVAQKGSYGTNRSGYLKDWNPDERERMAIACLYLQLGANPNFENERGNTTLAEAVTQGYEHLALLLCNNKDNKHQIKKETIMQAVDAAQQFRRYWFLTGVTKSTAWEKIDRSSEEWLISFPSQTSDENNLQISK